MTKINFKNNKTRTATTIIGALVIGLLVSSPITVFPNVNAQTTLPTGPPLPPQINGCYHYIKPLGWQIIPCASGDELNQIAEHPPTEGGNSGVYGISAVGLTTTFGKTDVHFSAFSGESDSAAGTNAWSIQTNTNFFGGSNGQTDWDQFVYQNNPAGGANNNLCIWQVINVDPGPPDYRSNLHCIGAGQIPVQTLSSSFDGYTYGNDQSGSLTGEFCINSGAQCWSVVTADSYNLAAQWVDTSGTILGYGNGSTANFASSTTETTTLTSTPESGMQLYVDITTGEQNNLSYTSESNSCSPTCTVISTSHI